MSKKKMIDVTANNMSSIYALEKLIMERRENVHNKN